MRNIMKKILLIMTLVILIISCQESKILDDNQETQVYSLINDFIVDSIYHPGLISIETMKFLNNVEDIPKPIPIEEFYEFNNLLFDTLFKVNIIDSSDLISIKKQFSQTNQFLWDPSRLKTRTFSTVDFDKKIKNGEIPKMQAFDYLKQNYNTRSFIKFSIPIFLKEKQLIIISVAFHCGRTCGEGADYVFKKINGKWTILYKEINWIS